MGGMSFKNIKMTLLLMMLMMLLSLDKLFLEQRKETTTGSLMSVTTVRILDKIRRDFRDSFFVRMGRILDQVAPEQSMEDIPIISRSLHLSNGTERRHHLQVEVAEQQPGTSASTATSSDTGPTNVRKRETAVSQTQHQQQHQAANNDLVRDCILYNVFEFKNSTSSKVKGNLKMHSDFWENQIHASDFIMNVIRYGYFIPFVTEPIAVLLKNNKSAFQHRDFVESAINELLVSGIVEEQTDKPFVVNPLSVAVNSEGKCRLILDLRHVNQCIDKRKFKMEGIVHALQMVMKNGFMYKFDLKSGYHHVDIHKLHQKYLGFSWKFENKTRYFIFTCLPFGLSSAPYLFTKLLRPLVKFWRCKGFKCIVYLDDGWGIAEDYATCVKVAMEVEKDLHCAGFVVNKEKSDFKPKQVIKWLGFVWNTNYGTLAVPDEKYLKFQEDIKCVAHNKNSVTARQLAKVTGKIVSFSFSLGNICYIMSRYMHIAIAECLSWDQLILFNDNILQEIMFWLNNCRFLARVCHFVSDNPPEQILYTDASNTAGAGYSVRTFNSVVHYMWTPEQRCQSSTWRELKAVQITLESLKNMLSNRLVKLYTDNQNVVRIVGKGSMNKELQK